MDATVVDHPTRAIRRSDADRIAGTLDGNPPAALGVSGKSVVGIYGLLCVYLKPH